MTTETYKIRDGSRVVSFDGVLLSAVSSERAGASRWTELELYKTESGKYVLSRVGRSVVTHVFECADVTSRLPLFVKEHPERDPDDFDYHTCVPQEYDLDKLLVEQDRFWALIADNAQDIIEGLHRKKDGVRFLPRMAVDLLERASGVDSAIADAFYVEKV